jgi:chemotaxis protein histidine kinase CheA
MVDLDSDLRLDLLDQAEENIHELEQGFLNLENAEDVQPVVAELLRLTWIARDISNRLEFYSPTELICQLESVLFKLKNNDLVVCSDLIDLFLRCNDRLWVAFCQVRKDDQLNQDDSDLVQQLGEMMTNHWIDSDLTVAEQMAKLTSIRISRIIPLVEKLNFLRTKLGR